MYVTLNLHKCFRAFKKCFMGNSGMKALRHSRYTIVTISFFYYSSPKNSEDEEYNKNLVATIDLL